MSVHQAEIGKVIVAVVLKNDVMCDVASCRKASRFVRHEIQPSSCTGLLNPQDEGTTIVRNVEKYTTTDVTKFSPVLALDYLTLKMRALGSFETSGSIQLTALYTIYRQYTTDTALHPNIQLNFEHTSMIYKANEQRTECKRRDLFKLTVEENVRKFPSFNATPRLITVFTKSGQIDIILRQLALGSILLKFSDKNMNTAFPQCMLHVQPIQPYCT